MGQVVARTGAIYGRWIAANGWSEALGLGTTLALGWRIAPSLERATGVLTVLAGRWPPCSWAWYWKAWWWVPRRAPSCTAHCRRSPGAPGCSPPCWAPASLGAIPAGRGTGPGHWTHTRLGAVDRAPALRSTRRALALGQRAGVGRRDAGDLPGHGSGAVE